MDQIILEQRDRQRFSVKAERETSVNTVFGSVRFKRRLYMDRLKRLQGKFVTDLTRHAFDFWRLPLIYLGYLTNYLGQRVCVVEESLSQALIRVFRQIGRVQWYGRMVEGCTLGETILLFVIRRYLHSHQRGPKVSELGGFLRVTTPSVTQMINGLEARGLVERGPDPEDRRVVRVRLTEEGLRVTQEAEESMRKETEGLIERLGEERARLLVELLSEAIHYFEEKNGACRPYWGHAAFGEGNRT